MNRRELLHGLAALGALGALRTAHAASASPVDYATDAAARRGDADIVRRALALHPGLHRYLSPSEVAAGLDGLGGALADAETREAAFLALSRFLARLRCGHTYCNPGNQRSAVARELFARRTRLPFEFRWLDGTMVVTRPYPSVAAALPRGTVVERIGGLPAPRLLASLLPYVRADGGNDGKRRALLGVRGDERVETFDAFHGLLFPPAGDTHRLRVRTPDRRTRRVEVPALGLPEREAERPRTPDGDVPFWTWDLRPDGVAVLTMPSWATYNASWKSWRPWLAERLASLEGARGLVVDLRANEGGNDCGDDILARLVDRGLPLRDGVQKIRFQRTPTDLDPYLDTWDDSFRTLGVGARPLGDGWYERPAEDGETVLAPQGPRLRVPTAVLVGPVNSSATFQFANRGRAAGVLTLFGTETGGNRRGINGGCFFFVHLPATGIEFDLPLVGYFPAAPQPDAGLVPDYVVRDTVEDVASGRDPTLAAAVAWAIARAR